MTRHLSYNENINIAGTFIDIGQLKAFSTVALPDSTWAYAEDRYSLGPLTLNTPILLLHAVNKQYADNLIIMIWKKAFKAAAAFCAVSGRLDIILSPDIQNN